MNLKMMTDIVTAQDNGMIVQVTDTASLGGEVWRTIDEVNYEFITDDSSSSSSNEYQESPSLKYRVIPRPKIVFINIYSCVVTHGYRMGTLGHSTAEYADQSIQDVQRNAHVGCIKITGSGKDKKIEVV